MTMANAGKTDLLKPWMVICLMYPIAAVGAPGHADYLDRERERERIRRIWESRFR
jgi:hypothetical protein